MYSRVLYPQYVVGAKLIGVRPGAAGALQRFPQHGGERNFLELKERTGNVIENKGALWKTRRRSGNIIENKGT